MKKFFILIAVFFSVSAHSVTFNLDSIAGCQSYTVSSFSCTDVKAAINACQISHSTAYRPATCSADPVTNGTVIGATPNGSWNISGIVYTTCSSGYHVDLLTNLCVANSITTCSTGFHLDTATSTCVADTPTAGTVNCLPSIRTVAPCPSGFAPSNVSVTTTETANPFSSSMDALPIQDMLYAIGVAICGLMGVAVGIKLV